MLRHRVLGIGINGDELVVAISDPDDVLALDDVRAATGMTVHPVAATRSDLRRLIDRRKREESDLGGAAAGFADDERRRVQPHAVGRETCRSCGT